MDVSKHPSSLRVTRLIRRAMAPEDARRARVHPAVRRQGFGKITVENVQRFDVATIARELPKDSRIVVRDANSEENMSRVEICYPLKDGRSAWLGRAALVAWIALGGWALALAFREKNLEV